MEIYLSMVSNFKCFWIQIQSSLLQEDNNWKKGERPLTLRSWLQSQPSSDASLPSSHLIVAFFWKNNCLKKVFNNEGRFLPPRVSIKLLFASRNCYFKKSSSKKKNSVNGKFSESDNFFGNQKNEKDLRVRESTVFFISFWIWRNFHFQILLQDGIQSIHWFIISCRTLDTPNSFPPP